MGFDKIVVTFLLGIFLGLLSSDLMSQTEESIKKTSFGFEGGVQFTNVYDNWTYSALPKSKAGFNMGVFIDYKFHPIVKLRLGAYYDSRGFTLQDVVSPIKDSSYTSYKSYFGTGLDYNLNYLTIPLSIFYEKGSEKFSIYLQGGVFYSLLLSAHRTGYTDLYIYPDHANKFEDERLRNPGHNITDYNNEDVFDLFTGNDWGVQLFLGMVYHINEKLDVQLSPGFTSSFAQLYAEPIRNSKWNNIYKINAGIIYSLN